MMGFLSRVIEVEREKRRKNAFVDKHKDCVQVTAFRGCDFFTNESNKIESVLIKGKGKYDWHNFTALSKFVRPDAICFDVGANIGVYSIIMADIVGRHGAVHSFEPVSHIRQKMKLNINLNGKSNIKLNDFALGEKKGSMEMLQVKKGQFRGGTSTFIKNENIDAMGVDKFEKVKVDIDTLDNYVENNNVDNIDFIKIDVEGFEFNVLGGGRNSIKRFSPVILMEYDPVRHNSESENFKSFFEEVKYSVYEFSAFNDDLVLVPFLFDGCPMGRNIICIKN